MKLQVYGKRIPQVGFNHTSLAVISLIFAPDKDG